MIALLPLRGWAGEVMATDMASTQVARAHLQVKSATESGAARAHIDWATATFRGKKTNFEIQKRLFQAADAQPSTQATEMHDCEGHAKGDKTTGAMADDASCDSCMTCQVCHTVALFHISAAFSLAFSPAFHLRPTAADFASAAAALSQKPPIS